MHQTDDRQASADLTCTNEPGGICTLNQACGVYNASFWNLAFKVQFAGTSNYMIVPIGAFATDNANGGCDLMLQYYQTNKNNELTAVLGSMFLQQYVAYFKQSGDE